VATEDNDDVLIATSVIAPSSVSANTYIG